MKALSLQKPIVMRIWQLAFYAGVGATFPQIHLALIHPQSRGRDIIHMGRNWQRLQRADIKIRKNWGNSLAYGNNIFSRPFPFWWVLWRKKPTGDSASATCGEREKKAGFACVGGGEEGEGELRTNFRLAFPSKGGGGTSEDPFKVDFFLLVILLKKWDTHFLAFHF